MNPLITAQLTGLYDKATLREKAPEQPTLYEQGTLRAKPKGPPKGWKKFTPMYREALIIVSMDQCAQASAILACPCCDSPRFYMDAFGWIWLKEKGLTEQDYVSACTVCGAKVWGIKPVTLSVCYYKPEPGFKRHPEDVVDDPDPYVDPPEPQEQQVNQEVSTDSVKQVGPFLPPDRRHKTKKGKPAPAKEVKNEPPRPITYKLRKKKLKDAEYDIHELHKAR
jgi:hypothetical protein